MTPQQIKAMKLALEALTYIYTETTADEDELIDQAITAIKEALAQPEQDTIQRLSALVRAQQITIDKLEAQPEQDNTYIYASSLATAIWQKHYMKESPKFALLDTTEGVLTQIDNMACGLVREKPAQPEQEPVMWSDYESNGIHHKPVAQTQEPFAYVNVEKRRLEFASPYVKWDTPTTIKLDKIPLYTTPPQRLPLTDKTITRVIDRMPKKMKGFMVDWDLYIFTRAIEAAHGIKENT